MIYTIVEYDRFENFYPFSLNHAVFEVRSGAFSVLERFQHSINKDDDIVLIVRDQIKDLVCERYPNLRVNPSIVPPSKVICMNQEVGDLYEDTNLSNFNEMSWRVDEEIYLWSFKDPSVFDFDKKRFSMKKDVDLDSSCILINKKNIYISSSSKISPGCILDASDGPIIIDDEVFIDIGALIKGNTYIGKNSIINPGAKLRGNISIGPCCKIGGEIEDTIFHGYSNKQHDGYLGHSYIGEWVNLGANTNNSDLKNNYSNVKFKIGEKEIDTEQMFAGCMVGDYVKTGISTMINTGTYIGLGANVFGAGFQNKFIPSFSWGKEDKTNVDKFLSTLKIVKERRKKYLSKSEIDFIKTFYNLNKL